MTDRTEGGARRSLAVGWAAATACLAACLLPALASCTERGGAPAPSGPAPASATPGLRAGAARAPDELRLCRDEEAARAGHRHAPRVLPPADPVRLRSSPGAQRERACEASAKQWGFSAKGSPGGCFVNAYLVPRASAQLVVDLATGLMWKSLASKELNYKAAKAYVANLDGKRWLGFSEWRLPTTEELLSILESVEMTDRGHHLDPDYFEGAREWWSSDTDAGGEGPIVVDATTSDCRVMAPEYELRVRAVRTLSRAEWEAAKKEYEEKK